MTRSFYTPARRPVATLWACLLALLLACGLPRGAGGQTPALSSVEEVSTLVKTLKADPRGPFQGLRWFCSDGSVRPAQERCEQPGGKQHGLLKQEIFQLQHTHHLFFDPVLTGTSKEAFWDADRQQSRLKQYLLQRYLFGVDDGWILRRAQYYRGALQAEDEAEWSRRFLTWLLQSDERLTQHVYLMREAVRGLPVQAESDLQQRIRAVSKELSDAYPPFLDLRVKLHGQPEPSDVDRVEAFRAQHEEAMSPPARTRLQTLVELLRRAYRTSPTEQIRAVATDLGTTTALAQRVQTYLAEVEGQNARPFVTQTAALLWTLRQELPALPTEQRRAALQVSVALEDAILRSAGRWTPSTLRGRTHKIYALAQAAAGAGLLEVWEWAHVEPLLRPPVEDALSVSQLQRRVQRTRRVADWGTRTVLGTYRPVVDTYEAFEPLARGFLDDRIRGSVLLSLGDAVGDLTATYAAETGVQNDMFDLSEARRAHGLNPGVALGILEVVPGDPDAVSVASDKIYVFRQPPTDLTPVAGIATVTEGNVVSHVQLLARNLSIPNATIPPDLLAPLQRYQGERVFYAVSPGGTVVMKRARDMTPQERALVDRQQRRVNRFRVPTEDIDLADRHLRPLASIRASDSGRLCGPKAAKMGELKALFPDRVPAGLVLPFGVFRAHMDQPMPKTGGSYWDFLQATFAAARSDSQGPLPPAPPSAVLLDRLAQLREAIHTMPLRAEFVAELRQAFPAVFGHALGAVPVFVRSDTNMEDLKDFTGAGLNLTVPNVVGEPDLLDAIRRVWASAYSERSYQWRQRRLTNPQDLYPSILLLRSVNVDASGVLLTTGLTAGTTDDVTVAFNRGVGGAVEGQAAEVWLLRKTGSDELIAPARETTYRTLPERGGVETHTTSFEAPILSVRHRTALRTFATILRDRLPEAPGVESKGPFDVELGFTGDQLWLFQVRPFVENSNRRSLEYLRSLDRAARPEAQVPFNAAHDP